MTSSTTPRSNLPSSHEEKILTLVQAISKNVKARRTKMGMSQKRLSVLTRLTIRYISRLENEAPNITVEVLERILKGLDCTLQELMFEKAKVSNEKQLLLLEEAATALKKTESVFVVSNSVLV